MGELTFFLGLQIQQKENGIFINQDKYVREILKKFSFFRIRSASTPMKTHKPLTKDENGEDVDVHLYRSMIGSLMYLTSSRPDIMFSVCACLRFQVQPKVSHLHAVKRIFKYLKGQLKLGHWYPKDSPLTLEAFSDSDYTGASLDRKSTIGVTIHNCQEANGLSSWLWTNTQSSTVGFEVKKDNDEVRIQALVDGKWVKIKESSIRRILRLDDAEGASCLTNTDIFEGLARMGAKTTSWNEFNSNMASSIVCLSTNQKFNFSRDFDTPSLTKKVFANIKRVGTGFSGEVTLLFDNMLVQAPEELEPEVHPTESQAKHNVPLPLPSHDTLPSGEDSLKLKELMELCSNLYNKVLDSESEVIDIKYTFKAKIEKLEIRVERLEEENRILKELKGVHSTVASDEPIMKNEKSSKQGRKLADINANVFSMLDVNDEEPADLKEVVDVVTTAKLITEVATTVGVDVNVSSVKDILITATETPKMTVEVPKPRKRRDEEVARQLEAELNADINWNVVIKQVKKSEILTDVVMKYQTLKRKPLTEAQARRNMIVYLKNMAGYKMNYFKGLEVDDESEMSLELLRLVRRQLNEGIYSKTVSKAKEEKRCYVIQGKVLLVEAQGNGTVLNEEESKFLVDLGIAEGPVTQSVITHNIAYQADDLDAYDFDCDEISTAKAVLMANVSSYGSDVLSKDTTSSAQQDALILYVFEELSNQVTKCNKVNNDNLIANETLSAELERYKERVKLQEERKNVDLGTRKKLIIDDIIQEKNAQFADFEKEIHNLKQTLSKQTKEKELLTKTFNVFKNESKEKEAKNIDTEMALEKKVKELDNIVCKMGQSTQTVHMLMKPHVFYDNNLKQALGFQNPFYLKKAQQIRPMLYDGNVIAKETNVISIADSKETLMLEEESRSKMLLKQIDPMVLEKKVNTKPINYAELN
uniref:Reverse transcriptase Ty1/copia-type domain-containing protein n=1 Tax=Tanacetum cinerariifolium TaxID=118510 RepID=A0A6L2MDJ1_TANCI|nr:hypothetical protein [Tanacetum cinerariifolium]